MLQQVLFSVINIFIVEHLEQAVVHSVTVSIVHLLFLEVIPIVVVLSTVVEAAEAEVVAEVTNPKKESFHWMILFILCKNTKILTEKKRYRVLFLVLLLEKYDKLFWRYIFQQVLK